MPVLIEACERPIAFELVQTADLCGWPGDRGDARWLDFMGDLRNALTKHQAEVRAHTAPPPPDPLTIETLFWSSIKDGGDAADFESYLQRYPHGQFADIARGRLTRGAPAPVKGALFDEGNYVFVSYPTDIAPALLIAVVRELLGRGLSIWLYDPSAYSFTAEEKARLRWQQSGGSWEQQTLDAIRGASAVVALVNEYSLQSRFQPREFKLAAQAKKLLPFIVSDLDYRALPPLFRDMHAPKITAEMLPTEVGKNRLANLASDAETLIARSKRRAKGAQPIAASQGAPPPVLRTSRRWVWPTVAAGLLAVAIAGVLVISPMFGVEPIADPTSTGAIAQPNAGGSPPQRQSNIGGASPSETSSASEDVQRVSAPVNEAAEQRRAFERSLRAALVGYDWYGGFTNGRPNDGTGNQGYWEFAQNGAVCHSISVDTICGTWSVSGSTLTMHFPDDGGTITAAMRPEWIETSSSAARRIVLQREEARTGSRFD